MAINPIAKAIINKYDVEVFDSTVNAKIYRHKTFLRQLIQRNIDHKKRCIEWFTISSAAFDVLEVMVSEIDKRCAGKCESNSPLSRACDKAHELINKNNEINKATLDSI